VSPDGDPVEIEVLVSSFAPQHIRAMQLAAEHAQEIGIELAVETLDPATIADRRSPNGPDDSPDVDAYIRAMEAHMHADPDAMIHFFGTPQPGRPGGGLTGYANPEFDELAEQAAVETDEEARLEMIHDLQAMFAQEVPAIILYHPDGLYAYRPAAYDGWVEDPGHGIFNKLSFLPGGQEAAEGLDEQTAEEAAEPIPEQDGIDAAEETAAGTPWLWIAGGVLLAVLLLVLLFLRGRAREEVYE
jgi:peptide/nickel transport system substrate-binding protein